MQENPNVYRLFPYGEVQRRLSDETVGRLAVLIRGIQDPSEDDSIYEHVTSIEDLKWSQQLKTRMVSFSSMITDINPVLIEHQSMPDYLKDTICAMIMAIQNTPDMALRAQTATLQNNNMAEYVRTVWADAQAARVTGETVILYRSSTSSGGVVNVEMRKSPDNVWTLGLSYEELRSYEMQSTGFMYRLANSQLFTDPVGSAGDKANIDDGLYLPCMLKLPNIRTSVTI